MSRSLRSLLTALVAGVAVLLLAAGPAAAYEVADDDGPHDGKMLTFADTGQLPAVTNHLISSADCVDGRAGPFPCENVDLLGYVSPAQLGGAGNDLWGWTDPETQNEYVVMGTFYNTAFVDVTDPTDPTVVGWMASEAADYIPLWRDVKVHGDHAFVVSEHRTHGMQVFDLTRLRDVAVPTVFEPDAVYEEFGNAHNIAINNDTGFAYAVGTDTCSGGLHMIDISEPEEPTFAGCFADDGYTHDVQCAIYTGPDEEHHDREICFASNTNTVTIVDVTDKADPVMLSRHKYRTASYTHQGWLTEDQAWFLFGDEGDETGNAVPSTTTYILDVQDLDAVSKPEPFHHDTAAIDHNLYITGDLVHQSNYTAGYRLLTFDDASLAAGELEEIGYFDVVPGTDYPEFAGTWSNYPFFDSGTVAVSTIETGLFLLRPHLDEDAEAGVPGLSGLIEF